MSQLREQVISIGPKDMLAIRKGLSEAFQQASEWEKKHKWNRPHDVYEHVTAKEIYDLGNKVIECKSIWEAYDLLANPTQYGKQSYYDAVIGVQHLDSYISLGAAMKQYEPIVAAEKGLDIAAGTGSSSVVLSKHCKDITAIDVVPSLLSVAQRKLERTGKRKERIHTLDMDIMRHTFLPESFDLILCNGLDSFVTQVEFDAFYGIVYGLLKPGGRYYETRTSDEEPRVYHIHALAELVGIVAGCVNMFNFGRVHHRNKGLTMPDLKEIGFSDIQVDGMKYDIVSLLQRKSSGKIQTMKLTK